MNQLKERWSTSPVDGIKQGLKLLKPHIEISANLSPKEVFLLREKGLRLKVGILFIINNIIWLAITLVPEPVVEKERPLPVKDGYEIVKLPAQIFTETPGLRERIHITLKHHSNNFKTQGYLRAIVTDPYGTTGSKAIVEIQKSDLEKLNSLNSYWLVYPFFKQQQKVKSRKKRRLHEVIF
jgi:hypothetical protein